MSKESMQLGEGFSADVKRAGGEPPKPRHAVIGWSLIVAILGAIGYFGGNALTSKPSAPAMQEKPGLHETLGHKFGGVLYYDIIRASINLPKEWDLAAHLGAALTGKLYEQTHFGPIRNTIVNAGENLLEDCFENNTGTACTTVANLEFHGLGTSSAAIAETDTGCTTELTTQYNPDSTRATGSQTNNGNNIYRTVGTNTVDAGVTINEFCLMSQAATGGGTMWTRILTGAIALSASDSLQTTYDLTIE